MGASKEKLLLKVYRGAPIRIVWKYTLFAALWILFSDQLLELVVRNKRLITSLQTVKGWLFVLVTSILLLGVINRYMREVREANSKFQFYEKRFQRYFEFGLVGLAVINEDRDFVEVNEQLCNILGYTEEHMLGMRFDHILAKSETFDYGAFDKIKTMEVEDQIIENKVLGNKGDEIVVQIAIRSLINEEGTFENYIIAVQDIHELKEAQQMQGEMNDQLAEEVEKQTEAVRKTNTQLRSALSKNEEDHLELVKLNQELKESLMRLEDTQKELIVSERMAALGNLVSNFAHELSTPVGTTLTANSFLMEETKKISTKFDENKLGKKAFKDYIDRLSETFEMTAANLEQISEMLLNYKNVAVDQMHFVKRKIDLRQYIEEVFRTIELVMSNAHYEIEINCNEDCEVETYPMALFYIINHLAVNAIGHGFADCDQGKIVVNIAFEENQVIIYFMDNGNGMSEETMSKIFEPFFSANPNQESSGLGLYIVYNIVTQKLKGDIICKSEVGVGTRYMIEFPIY